MKSFEIYIANPYMTHSHAIAFIKTLCGGCHSALYAKVEYPEFWYGNIRSDDIVFALLSGPNRKDLKEIIPHYLSGKLKGISNVIGYLFLLRMELIDFEANQGDVDIENGSPWYQYHHRHPDSSYIYTKWVKHLIDYFQQIAPNKPYVIVLGYDGNLGLSEDDLAALCRDMRQGFELGDTIRILPCAVRDKEDVKTVVLGLMEVVGEFPEKDRIVPLIDVL